MKQRVVAAIIWSYGMTKKEAERYYKSISEERRKLILEGFENNAKKCFEED